MILQRPPHAAVVDPGEGAMGAEAPPRKFETLIFVK